jgi:HAD superfamily hydrolase (TIGR01509 family)
MKFQAAIFDMDGTIILTEEIWQQTAIKLIEQYNGLLSAEEKRNIEERITGAGLATSVRIIKDAIKLKSSQNKELSDNKITKEYKALALSFYSKDIQFVPGFEKFYSKLKKLGIPTAIATNAPLDVLQETNRILNLERYFGNHLYSISQINNLSKPNPAIYLFAAQQLGIDPKKCLAFEDSFPGITAAKAAGMYCIGIKNPLHAAFSQNADSIINSYDQIDLTKFF